MKKSLYRVFAFFIIILLIVSCTPKEATERKVSLNPENPVTISVWHYYNGPIMNAFEAIINEFNDTIGTEEGIIVEGHGYGDVSELEQAVMSSAKKEVGSRDIPNIFASYADTAYEAEKMGILANLNEYFTKDEENEYWDSYIEEGKIGSNGELKIFPIAKSTEVLMLNETDWLPFANENNLSYDDLKTVEGVTHAAELYYEWTDSKTPDIPNDGKAFFGRDSMANYIIISSKELGTEIFQVENGIPKINIDRDVMKKIWDNYYIPYISGYFISNGRFRSDDAKVGDLLAYVGSTPSASYFPKEVTVSGKTYPVRAKILPDPYFKDAKKVMVQQGAGMVVTKSTPEEEYASTIFLKWFTDVQTNIEFSSLSGYMPVKKEAVGYDTLISNLKAIGKTLDEITDETLSVALEEMKSNELYTNKAFDGGTAARDILDNTLQDMASTDRKSVLESLKKGKSLKQAVAPFDTEENFNNWLQQMTTTLQG